MKFWQMSFRDKLISHSHYDIICRKLRSRKPNQILISLCFALLCLYVAFLVMITFDRERGVEEVSEWPCRVIAALIHYFTLTSMFWMAVEGYNMHRLFVEVLNIYLPNFLRKVSVFAWGMFRDYRTLHRTCSLFHNNLH